eukprot:c14859_g1_i2 orf=31-1047(+)
MEGESCNLAVEVAALNLVEPWEACEVVKKAKPSAPPAGQVVVKMLCRCVNPSDVDAIRGTYSGWHPPSFPAVPGFEGMGTIDQVGEDVCNVKVGQRVFPMSNKQGVWQEYIVVCADDVIPIPPSLSDEIAAQFLVNPWTVVGMLEVLQVPKGDFILQTAASSVLGRIFIQYAHHMGIKTINVVRRSSQVKELKALGADVVINSTLEDVVEKVKKATNGEMVHSAIDCVGGKMTNTAVSCVRDGSTVIVFGALGSLHIEASIPDLVFRGIKLQGFWLFPWLKSLSHTKHGEIKHLLMSLLEKNIITPLVGEKFPLHAVQEAIIKSLEPNRGGKVLLVSY